MLKTSDIHKEYIFSHYWGRFFFLNLCLVSPMIEIIVFLTLNYNRFYIMLDAN